MPSEAQESPLSQSYDVVIAGGGASGMLCASRMAEAFPSLNILILEKEEALGGRLRANKPGATRHSFGLNAISPKLFNYWNQSLKADPEAPDLSTLVDSRQQRFGSMAAGKVLEAGTEEWLSGKGSRVIGGFAAKRQWAKVTEILGTESADSDEDDEDDSKHAGAFSQCWKLQRKAPAAIVLEHYSNAFGIADLWSAAPEAIAARGEMLASSLHYGNFERPLEALVEPFGDRITVVKDCWIAKATRDNDQWVIETEKDTVHCKTLVVAQPPWEAVLWLDRTYWPPSVLSILSKTKPVSAVVMSATISAGELDIPEVTFVPSDKVQIIRNTPEQITFQATIDFEISLQAPDAVKAVKRLKRAARKLVKMYEGLELTDEHIALAPYAWPHSPLSKDKRYFQKLASKPINTNELMFVGDAYGANFDGDENIVTSITNACETLNDNS